MLMSTVSVSTWYLHHLSSPRLLCSHGPSSAHIPHPHVMRTYLLSTFKWHTRGLLQGPHKLLLWGVTPGSRAVISKSARYTPLDLLCSPHRRGAGLPMAWTQLLPLDVKMPTDAQSQTLPPVQPVCVCVAEH